MKEYERFDRIGTTPHRSYYIPFAPEDVVRTKQQYFRPYIKLTIYFS